jgi:RNA polymerase sigma factor (TIGR02999 family)
VDQRRATFHSRSHFFAVAAQLMRRIIIDHARMRGAAKRGSNQKVQLAFDPGTGTPPRDSDQLVELDAALNLLEQKHPGKGRLVELRYFGGLTIDETAEVLGLSPATVRRDWSATKAWLARAMSNRGAIA